MPGHVNFSAKTETYKVALITSFNNLSIIKVHGIITSHIVTFINIGFHLANQHLKYVAGTILEYCPTNYAKIGTKIIIE